MNEEFQNILNKIDDYLRGHLSEAERKAFEKQLDEDPFLQQLLDEQKIIMEGVKLMYEEEWIKQKALKARQKAENSFEPNFFTKLIRLYSEFFNFRIRSNNFFNMNQFSLIFAAFAVFAIGTGIVTYQIHQQEAEKEQYIFAYQTVITDHICNRDVVDRGLSTMDKIREKMTKKYHIPIAEQKQMGLEFHNKHLLKNFDVINDHRTDKLRDMMNKMRPYVDNQFDFQVYVVRHKEHPSMVNAFTVAGGRVYFTEGLLEMAENDDMLAVVMGHELGHNCNGHVLENWKKLKQYEATIGKKFKIFGRDISLEPLAQVLTVIDVLLSSPFGQPDEEEADYAGVYLATKAGYDPKAGIEIFRKFGELSNRQDEWMISKLLYSHPRPGDRYECLKDYIKDAEIRALNTPPPPLTLTEKVEKYEAQQAKTLLGVSLTGLFFFGFMLKNQLFQLMTGTFTTGSTLSLVAILPYLLTSAYFGKNYVPEDTSTVKTEVIAERATKDLSEPINTTAYVNTKKDPLNLRLEPSIHGEVIAQIPKGGFVNCIECCCLDDFDRENGLGKWCRVEYDGKIGYAWGWYLILNN